MIRAKHLNIEELSTEFKCDEYFDHIVIDDFLDESKANELSENFPKPEEKNWWSYNNPLEKKLAYNKLSEIPGCFRDFFSEVNSDSFLSWLSQLSGIKNLRSDPSLLGGGLHLIKRGGKLDVHEDFNIHRKLNALRCLNLIVYLNKDWKEDWGGHLELWNKDMSTMFRKISPSFNTAVIFRTDMNSNHGHPHPLECPQDRFRISLASYYYQEISNDAKIEYKSTSYKKLPDDDDGLDDLREKRKLGRLKDETT